MKGTCSCMKGCDVDNNQYEDGKWGVEQEACLQAGALQLVAL